MEENYTWKVWSERKIGSLEEGERGGEEKKLENGGKKERKPGGYRKRTKGRKETSPSASIRAPSCTSPSPWVEELPRFSTLFGTLTVSLPFSK